MSQVRWAVEVWEGARNNRRAQQVALQLFDTEQEAREYARGNTSLYADTQYDNWCNVREAFPDEKEFA